MECSPVHPTHTSSIMLSPGATLSPLQLHSYRSRGCSFDVGTRLWVGQLSNDDFITSTGNRFLAFSKHPDSLWGPPSLNFLVYQGTFSWWWISSGMMQMTHLHLVLRSRMNATTRLLPMMPSWCAQNNFTLTSHMYNFLRLMMPNDGRLG